MGFEGQVWRLVRREESVGAIAGEIVGEIVIEEADFPWLHGRFVPGEAFPAVQPLFARSLALSEAEDWEAFDAAYEEITSTVSMVSPAGPVAEFLLHIQDDEAWFRWSDEPFGDGRGEREADGSGSSAGSGADLDVPEMTPGLRG
ncbi:hypothetical protein ACFVVX_20230 [Kitasatospora sp. NPDC058170]|uniref:hypothetical protein n=1 Tax=Kitasatospora sp. NPDC058170 TaxID=3346364 RepID=UPI0036D818A9